MFVLVMSQCFVTKRIDSEHARALLFADGTRTRRTAFLSFIRVPYSVFTAVNLTSSDLRGYLPTFSKILTISWVGGGQQTVIPPPPPKKKNVVLIR